MERRMRCSRSLLVLLPFLLLPVLAQNPFFELRTDPWGRFVWVPRQQFPPAISSFRQPSFVQSQVQQPQLIFNPQTNSWSLPQSLSAFPQQQLVSTTPPQPQPLPQAPAPVTSTVPAENATEVSAAKEEKPSKGRRIFVQPPPPVEPIHLFGDSGENEEGARNQGGAAPGFGPPKGFVVGFSIEEGEAARMLGVSRRRPGH